MNAPFLVLAAIAGLALVYVLFPIAAMTFARYRGTRLVRCPETGIAAEIEVDARHAALTALGGTPDVRVTDCTLWPGRAGCAGACARETPA
jgi:hypothetical protein